MNQLYPNWDNVQYCRELDRLVAYFAGYTTYYIHGTELWKDASRNENWLWNFGDSETRALQIWKLMPRKLNDRTIWWTIGWSNERGIWVIWKNW